MSRKQRAIGLSFALAAVLAALAFWALTYQPAFYRTALVQFDAPEKRDRQAASFTLAVTQLADEIEHQDRWSQQFSEQSLNGWLAKELSEKFAELLPAGIEQPRVRFEQDELQIGFRARRGIWSGIVSARLRVWVARRNQLACEIQSLRAGLAPIPADDMLQSLVDGLNQAGWRVEWKSGDGADVLLVTLDAETRAPHERPRPVLEALELVPGKLRVSGRRSKPGDDADTTASYDDAADSSRTQ